MAVSTRKLEANRANAQKSTGPQSAASREKVSQNATRHGLCGQFRVLECESQSRFDTLLERFLEDEKPANDVERELVVKMARHTWLSERAVRMQESCFAVFPSSEEDIQNGESNIGVRNELDRFLRYQTTHDRAYQRAAAELAKRRKERELQQRGFVSQKRAEAEDKRREERHICAVERAKQAFLRDQIRLEREQIRAANELGRQLPPDFFKSAA